MLRLVLLLSALAATGSPALAHLDPAEHGSLMAGLSHPSTGADHALAMLMVGVWAALLGGRAIWLVPGAFVTAMTLGFGAAAAGVAVPFVEPAILASVVVLGLLGALALPVPTGVGMALVAGFALFHGYAHGSEIGDAGMAPYAIGFIVATATMHAAGAIGSVLAMSWLGAEAGRRASRVAGAAVAVGGMVMALS